MSTISGWKIPGWMSHGELQWLIDHARKAETIVEVGSYMGRSTRALADHTRGKVYAVDSWQDFLGMKGVDIRAAFDMNLADLIAKGVVIPVQQDSKEEPPHVEADLVFIDADHSYDAVKHDILLYSKILKSGGIMSGHDYSSVSNPEVVKAVDELFGAAAKKCESIWWVQR